MCDGFAFASMQLASEDYELQARSLVLECTGQHKTDPWLWVQAPFSSAVWTLKAVGGVPKLGLLGQGAHAKVH